jgi:hypothetical protein
MLTPFPQMLNRLAGYPSGFTSDQEENREAEIATTPAAAR